LPVNFETWSDLAKSQFLETNIFMSGYLLSSQGDRMSMGNSVEGRYPFLDYRVIEFCSKLPDNFKLNGLNEKFLLKKLSLGRIPDSISGRPKQAYRAPISDSFCKANAPENIQDILSRESIKSFGIFDPEKVEKLMTNLRDQKNISEIDQMAITGIVSTQLTHKMFVKDAMKGNINRLNNYKLTEESKIKHN
jgi:asparagine synthase (glutamine-hydrolysing)